MADPVATITMALRSDGRVDMGSTFHGRHDATYGAMAPERATQELARLLAELREQEAQHLAAPRAADAADMRVLTEEVRALRSELAALSDGGAVMCVSGFSR